MIKSVILDFDGVILESVDAKARAFAELFKEHPEQLDRILDFHRQNGGMNRYPKIRHIFENILRLPLSDSRLTELGTRFGHLAMEEVRNSPFVPGALDFIRSASQRKSLAIVSASPYDELQAIVAERGLSPFFRMVLGAPTSKAENLAKVLCSFEIAPEEAVFVGDAMADYQAARQLGVPFIARIAPGFDPFAGIDVQSVPDLLNLEARVREMGGPL